MDLQTVRAAKKKHCDALLKKANVVGVGVGYKMTGGKKTEELCIIVDVSKKLPMAQLRSKDAMPISVDGVPIDVIETKHIQAWAFDPTAKHRPAVPGSSIGHHNITAGTFGCVVKDAFGVQYILSNNHVLADSNNGEAGDLVIQPGAVDGGTSEDGVGSLYNFVPIVFEGGGGGDPPPPPIPCPIGNSVAAVANIASAVLGRKTRLLAFNADPEAAINFVDAAICLPTVGIVVAIAQIGAPTGAVSGRLNLIVQKYGRTTKYTQDTITQIDATIMVSYGAGRTARFDDQLVAGPMSAGGDSGSAVLDMENNVTGLLFAGSETTTIINRIENVLSALDVQIVLPSVA